MPSQLARPVRLFALVVTATALLGALTTACGTAATGAGESARTTGHTATTGHTTMAVSAHRTLPGPVAGRPPVTAVPKYFIDTVLFSGAVSGGLLQVRVTATGSLASQPAVGQVLAVASLGSRSFVIARPAGTCATELVKASLNADGRLGGLVRLGPILRGEVVSMTADADANAIGVTAWTCSKSMSGYLGVVDLRTGAVRRWGSVSVDGSAGAIALGDGLSMSANGGLVAFTGSTVAASGRPTAQDVWVLKTTSRSGPLALRSRVVLRAGPGIDSVSLAPSGKSFYLCTMTARGARLTTDVAAYRTSDGRRTARLAGLTGALEPASGAPNCPMAADQAGELLLVPYSMSSASRPETGPLVQLARIDIARRSVASISFRLPGSAGMSVADGITVAW